MPDIKKLMENVAFEVVKEHDWEMPKFSEDKYDDFSEYECDCLDIGHDYEPDIAAIVCERIIKNNEGILLETLKAYEDFLSGIIWQFISDAIDNSIYNINNVELLKYKIKEYLKEFKYLNAPNNLSGHVDTDVGYDLRPDIEADFGKMDTDSYQCLLEETILPFLREMGAISEE